MTRVLVVEDEADIRETLEYNLQSAGYDILTAADGREALRLARERHPDLILLDLMLPDISGTEVCRTLKERPETASIAIVMVTAKTEEIDRVIGFELGADDYVTKPFSVRELLLRVRAVLRRGTDEPSAEGRISFGCLTIDSEAHRVWVEREEVELTALEFRLLVTLCERRGRVQSRSALLDAVWGTDAKISERTVDAHVKRLRHRLGAARDYVQTVRGVGYRFEPPAQRATFQESYGAATPISRSADTL